MLLWALRPDESFLEQVAEATKVLFELIGEFEGYAFMKEPPDLEGTEGGE